MRLVRPACVASLLFLAACEHGVTIHTRVRVPRSAQSVAAERPQRLRVYGHLESGHSFSYNLGIICDATDEEILVEFTHDGLYSCRAPGQVTAWLEPLDQTPVRALCRIDPVEIPPTDVPAPTGPQASEKVFSGVEDTACHDGEATVDLVLQKR